MNKLYDPKCSPVCKCIRFHDYFVDHPSKLDIMSLSSFCKRQFYSHCNFKALTDIVDLFVNSNDLTTNIVLQVLMFPIFESYALRENKTIRLCVADKLLNKLFSRRLEFKEKDLISFLKYCSSTCVGRILDYSCFPSALFLDEACDLMNIDLLKEIVNIDLLKEIVKFGIKIEKKHFNSVMVRHNSDHVAKIIDIFVEHGYKITREDVKFSIKNKCYINNIEKHNIELDDEITNVCVENNYFPYDNISKPTIKALREACKQPGNIKNIRWILSLGVKPDVVCLQNACCSKSNVRVLRELCKYGVKCDKVCLDAFADDAKSQMLKEILDNLLEFKEQVIKEEKEVKTKQENKENEENEEEEDDESEEDLCVVEIEQLDVEWEKHEELTLTKYAKNMFEVDESKITFLKLRTLFLQYVYENDLFVRDCTRINTELSEILDIERNNYFSFDDIPNVMFYFIK